MHRRMQRLDPAVHHFGKSGEIADVDHREARIAQRLAGAAGGNKFDAVARERAGEFNHACFVGDGNKGAHRAAKLCHRSPDYHNGSLGSSARTRWRVAAARLVAVLCWKVHSTRGVVPALPRMTT